MNDETVIEEIILENFMSYEYARIPFRRGLNIISGPNGSGKSSILLAISVALGQAYTERSRKLSDLIRRGSDAARISLLFDNRPRNGDRPLRFSKSDTFMLSRYLRKDGMYWYEADYRQVSKHEVARLLRNLGIHPDNMLVIMHQNMIEEFTVLSSQEKLKLVEEAVGFQEYRERILGAQQKLTELISEEGSVSQILGSAEQTLSYWSEVYEKYLQKKELIEHKGFLERELAWAQIIRHERSLQSLNEKLDIRIKKLHNIRSELDERKEGIEKFEQKIAGQRIEERKLYYSLLEQEKESARIQSAKEFLDEVRKFADIADIKELDERVNEDMKRKDQIDDRISAIQANLGNIEDVMKATMERYINLRIDEAVLDYQRRQIEDEIEQMKGSIVDLERKLSLLQKDAGERIDTQRTPNEISEEMSITGAKVQSLGEIPEDIEKMYSDYSSLYEELKQKMEIVTRNRENAMKDVEERMKIWRKVLHDLLEEINPIYQDILSRIIATGSVALTDTRDVEAAGLELMVGYRGATPTVLDGYTQSGGERSVAVMAFLLALQQHVISFFRAVDEFDTHMDPRNRDAIFRMIISSVRESDMQYLLITPRQLAVTEPDVHIIMVQNALGKSEIKEIRR